MDHRTALATMRTLARRAGRAGLAAGTVAGRTAGRAASTLHHEVTQRVAARRSPYTFPSTSAAPPTSAVTDPAPASRPESPVATDDGSAPSPTAVARAVGRNAAGLPRTTPHPQQSPRRRSGPGAKLPARAGQGIVGV